MLQTEEPKRPIRFSARQVKCFVIAVSICALLFAGFSQAFADGQPDPFDKGIEIALENGEYDADVSLQGGSGRASLSNPATIVVRSGHAIVRIEWSSPYYDYMIVDGDKYLRANADDASANSIFEIPMLDLDEPFEVIGDTTAMGEPHEVEYKITLDSSTIEKRPSSDSASNSSSASSKSAATDSASSVNGESASGSNVPTEVGGIPFPVIITIVLLLALAAGIALGVIRGRKSREF